MMHEGESSAGELGAGMRRPGRPRRLRAEFLSVIGDLLVAWDFATTAGAGYACAALYQVASRLHGAHPVFQQSAGGIALLGGVLAAAVMRGAGQQGAGRMHWRGVSPLARDVGRRVLLLACLMLTIGFLTRILDAVPRLWVLAWIATIMAAAIGGRAGVAALVQGAVRRGVFMDRVAIVGTGEEADRLVARLQAAAAQGVQVVGVFSDAQADPWSAGQSLEALLRLGRDGRIDRVILALPSGRHARMLGIVERLKALDIEASFYAPLPGLEDQTARLGYVAGAPVIVLSKRPIRQWGIIGKLTFDWVVALLALILLTPLLAAIAILLRLDSPGPVLFRQTRHGRNNAEISVYKFRSMTHVAVAAGDALQQTRRGDERITRVGRFLRETSLDELPQLLNVLNGTMSLVGPRPHAVIMRTEDLSGEQIIAEYPQRHRIKPGMTGWAQINGLRGATETADQVRARVRHDLYYVENWSFLLDLKIILATPIALVFRRDNAF